MVLAQMMDWQDSHGWGNGWGWAVMIALVLLIVLVTVLLVRHLGGERSEKVASPRDVLANRFARGEIDEEEYRRRRDALRE